jgi:tRNA 2-selenouridine synthase
MPQALALKEFLQKSDPILDVRSPSEFLQGHIPGSHSLFLFNDEERAQIGTVYKKQSRQEAIELGLLILQSKLDLILNQTATLLTSTEGRVLCWRGGMRSGFLARLLQLLGHRITTLKGGYKTYRRWVLEKLDQLELPFLCVLGGLTGSNKTTILQALQLRGEQIIDLEDLAKHRGSAFGGIGLTSQPTQEQFENELAMVIERLDLSKPIWIEDESRLIGRCHLPKSLYQKMLQAPLFYIQRSTEERLIHLLAHYGQASKQQLSQAVHRIAKRLGSQLTKETLQLIEQGNYEQAFERLLAYYDKTYQYQVAQRQVKYSISECSSSCPDQWACLLQNSYHSIQRLQA